MAYKFSVGTYRHSGSMVAEEGLTIDAGGLIVTGSVLLPAGEINTAELADAAVTAAKLAADAVETAKIKDANVTAAKLATDAVETAKIKDANVTTAKLADAAVTNAKLQNNSVSFNGVSVALGASGSFSTTAVAEGDNLYFTQARARQSLSVADTNSIDMTYASGSGEFQAALRLSGSGLQVTADGLRIAAAAAGTGLAWSDGILSVDTAEIAAGLSGSVRDIVADFVEGSDFVTFDDSTGTIGVSAAAFSGSADAAFDARLATKSTTNLAEGSNLYFTDARARQAVSIVDAGGDGSFTYDSGSGVFTYTGPSSAEVRAHLNATDGINYNASTGVFSLTSSVAGAGLGLASGVLDVLATGAIAVKNDRVALSSSVAGDGLGFIASGLGDVSQLKVNVDASSIEINADALRVKALGITNAMLSGAIQNDKLLNSSVTVTGGNGLSAGGTVALGSTVTLDVQVDSAALEINGSDQVALKSTITGDRTFANNVTVSGDLTVNGTTTYLNTNELIVKDALVTIASGSAAFAANQGIELGSYASLKTAAAVADVGNALSSSLPLVAPSMKAATFYGNLSGSMQLSIETTGINATISKNVTRASANVTLTLPTAPVVGQEHRIKCVGAADNVIVAAQVGGTIDGASSIVLESPSAAVSLVWDGSAWMVF